MNVVLFGAMCDSLGCPQIDWEQVVADTVPEKVKDVYKRQAHGVYHLPLSGH